MALASVELNTAVPPGGDTQLVLPSNNADWSA